MSASKPKTERFNTIIIGAGQNGLATGYHLAQRGSDFLIVDGGARAGDSWRNRWDSLRLFTWAYWNELPGMSFPCAKTHLPSKDEVADYLESYAQKFELPIRFGVRAEKLTREDDRYVLTTPTQRLEAKNVVVATGPFSRPKQPAFASELDASIAQMHSSAYRNPSQLEKGDTLVVGAAASGAEIAMELAQSRRVYMSGRDVPTISRGKASVLRHIMPWVFSRPRGTFLGNKLLNKSRTKGHPIILKTYKDVLKTGVERVPRVIGVRDGKPLLDGDRVLDVANVVWGTGFQVDFSWIDLPIFGEDGYPRHLRGVVEEEPGLYFVGLIFLHSLASQLMLGVRRDAKFVAEELMRRAGEAQPALVGGPPEGLRPEAAADEARPQL